MKRHLVVFMMIATAAGFTACSSDDEVTDEVVQVENEQEAGKQEQDTRTVIKPATDIDESIATFCNLMLCDGMLGFIPGQTFADTCICLNSDAEMAAFFTAPWSLTLPAIDFSKYTLLVGQKSRLGAYCKIMSHQIREEEGRQVIDLMVTDYSQMGKVTYHPTFLSFWGLYPKLEQKVFSIHEVFYVEHPMLGTIPVDNVDKSTLPTWLCQMIDEWETETPLLDDRPTVYRGDWKGQTVYFTYSYLNKTYQSLYLADGSIVEWNSDTEAVITSDIKDWICIYNAGLRNHGVGSSDHFSK